MGIDVYLNWHGMKEADKNAQYTGFSIVSGNVGYLREAYHGGPYATRVLLPEGWDREVKLDRDHTFAIEAKTLRERLPAAVMATIYRHHVLYDDEPATFETNDIVEAMSKLFVNMRDESHATLQPDAEQLRQTEALIKERKLPDYALAYVDFVELAERKEAETGKPCRVLVSA